MVGAGSLLCPLAPSPLTQGDSDVWQLELGRGEACPALSRSAEALEAGPGHLPRRAPGRSAKQGAKQASGWAGGVEGDGKEGPGAALSGTRAASRARRLQEQKPLEGPTSWAGLEVPTLAPQPLPELGAREGAARRTVQAASGQPGSRRWVPLPGNVKKRVWVPLGEHLVPGCRQIWAGHPERTGTWWVHFILPI